MIKKEENGFKNYQKPKALYIKYQYAKTLAVLIVWFQFREIYCFSSSPPQCNTRKIIDVYDLFHKKYHNNKGTKAVKKSR